MKGNTKRIRVGAVAFFRNSTDEEARIKVISQGKNFHCGQTRYHFDTRDKSLCVDGILFKNVTQLVFNF